MSLLACAFALAAEPVAVPVESPSELTGVVPRAVVVFVDVFDPAGSHDVALTNHLRAALKGRGYELAPCEALFGQRQHLDQTLESTRLRVDTAATDDPSQLLALLKSPDCLVDGTSAPTTYLFASAGVDTDAARGGERSAWFSLVSVERTPGSQSARITDYRHSSFSAPHANGVEPPSWRELLTVAVDTALSTDQTSVVLLLTVPASAEIGTSIPVSTLGSWHPHGTPFRVELKWERVGGKKKEGAASEDLRLTSTNTGTFQPEAVGFYRVTARTGEGTSTQHAEAWVDVQARERADLQVTYALSPGAHAVIDADNTGLSTRWVYGKNAHAAWVSLGLPIGYFILGAAVPPSESKAGPTAFAYTLTGRVGVEWSANSTDRARADPALGVSVGARFLRFSYLEPEVTLDFNRWNRFDDVGYVGGKTTLGASLNAYLTRNTLDRYWDLTQATTRHPRARSAGHRAYLLVGGSLHAVVDEDGAFDGILGTVSFGAGYGLGR